MLMGIPHATDAFVEAEKPHAVVRSFIPTYEQHYFLAILREFVKKFLKKAWRQESGERSIEKKELATDPPARLA
jgi:hypothetical protein